MLGARFGTFRRRVAGLFFVVGIAGSCTDRPGPAGGAGEGTATAPRTVRTVPAAEVALPRTVLVNGTLAAHEEATIAAKVAGRLQSFAVDLGSRVRRDQVLARIDPTDYALRVQQAQAALDESRARLGLGADDGDRVEPEQTGTVRQATAVLQQARAQRDRAAALFEEGLLARADMDAAEAAYKVADSRYQDAREEIRSRQATAGQRRADVALATQQLSDTTVVAPFDGVIGSREASVGEYLAAGAPLVLLVKVDPLRFRAEVPERESGTVARGQTVRLSVDGISGIREARLSRVSPLISERNRVLAVEADVRNDGSLRAGSFARAEIVTDATTTAITVPNEAVASFAGLNKVFVVENGKAAERAITAGRRTEGWTEVVSGLAANEEVVVAPGNLQSGQAVTVAPAES